MRVFIELLSLVAAVGVGLSACRRTPPEDVRVDGRPVSAWIAAAVNLDDPRGQRAARQALRHAGPPAVPALRHAMEHTTDPELRARVGLAFTFLCPSVLPALREEARAAQGDVRTQLEMAAQVIASETPETGAGGC